MLAVAVIEEAAKLVIPAALLFSIYRRKPANGLVIGVAFRAGSAVLETMGYLVISSGWQPSRAPLSDHHCLTSSPKRCRVRSKPGVPALVRAGVVGAGMTAEATGARDDGHADGGFG